MPLTKAKERMIDNGIVSIKDYGTDATALQAAVTAAANGKLIVNQNLSISSAINVSSNTEIEILAGYTITQTTTANIFNVSSASNVYIHGGILAGLSETARPSPRGLIYGSGSSDIRIENVEIKTFGDLIWLTQSDRIWIEHCKLHDYEDNAIVLSQCTRYHAEHNEIYGNTESDDDTAYGIQAVGDSNNSNPNEFCTIIGNHIDGVKSWSAITTHDSNDLMIVGNTITDCRNGMDIGIIGLTDQINNVVITGNFVKATTTNYRSDAASMGIQIQGKDGKNMNHVVVSDNIVDGFATFTDTGNACGNIAIQNVNDVSVTGNVLLNAGTGSAKNGGGITIAVNVSNAVISNNTITDCSNQGILMISCDYPFNNVLITNNMFSNPTGTMTTGIKFDSISPIDVVAVDNYFGANVTTKITGASSFFSSGSLTYDFIGSTPTSIAQKGQMVKKADGTGFYGCTSRVDTTLSSACSTTTCAVTDGSAISNGDNLWIPYDTAGGGAVAGQMFRTTVSSGGGTNTLTLAAAPATTLASGQPVFTSKWA